MLWMVIVCPSQWWIVAITVIMGIWIKPPSTLCRCRWEWWELSHMRSSQCRQHPTVTWCTLLQAIMATWTQACPNSLSMGPTWEGRPWQRHATKLAYGIDLHKYLWRVRFQNQQLVWMQKHLFAPFKSCMQQKALYKFFFISCFVDFFFCLFCSVLGFFVYFFNIVRFNFSLGGIRWFSIFLFISLSLKFSGKEELFLWTAITQQLMVQSHFMCLLPLKMWINRLQNYQTILDHELFLSPFPTCKCLLAVLLLYYFVSEGDTSACR